MTAPSGSEIDSIAEKGRLDGALAIQSPAWIWSEVTLSFSTNGLRGLSKRTEGIGPSLDYDHPG